MKTLYGIFIGISIGVVLCINFFGNVIEMNADKHKHELNRMQDSLAKQNGIIQRHVCYP